MNLKPGRHLFTSESVSMGHPDKICDQISDAVLDAYLEEDPYSRVACETFITTGLVVVGGEITSKAQNVDIPTVVRRTLREIGYSDASWGIDYENCAVMVCVGGQSADIAQGVDEGKGLHKEQGAGDQGMMIGYAVNETPEMMPLTIMLAHQLVKRLAELREQKEVAWLRPDSKSQVTVEYEGKKPVRVHTVVISTQHAPEVSYETLRDTVIEKVIKATIPSCYLDGDTIYHVNPTGRFVTGGPKGDTGLTGRKIIVDTYGGRGRHGGGAFSGKDPTKVDRSAAYAMRYVAKNVVAAGLAQECDVQVAYAIGVARPVSIAVNTFGTGRLSDERIRDLIVKYFDLTPKGIITHLDLRRPIYRFTARHGHFGRTEDWATWEKTDKAELLRKEVGLREPVGCNC